MAIKGVIFDLGNTLMVLDSTWPEVFERGAADLAGFLVRERVPVEPRAFAQALLDRRAEAFARAKTTMREVTATETMLATFAQFGIAELSGGLVAGAIDTFFAYEDARWHADPDALEVLDELAGRGLQLGLFSNASDDLFIQHLVDRLGFRPWLDPALSSAGTGMRKPDPAALEPFEEAWGLAAMELVMVGDRLEADILGARRAGMRSVWLRARGDARQEDAAADQSLGAIKPEAIVEPDASIHRLADLPACLTRLQLEDGP
jgi:putative hydrolase of the HAD superfamily